MTSPHERSGALESIEGILSRGGDADDVLRDVLAVLFQLYAHVAIDFVEDGRLVRGPALGSVADDEVGERYPVLFQGAKVAELVAAWPEADDAELLERVATLIAPYCLVGWDTGGEEWRA